MVFGELLGGIATRAGERFNENTQRQRAIEDWQRAQRVGMWSDFMRQNWDNLQADQQEAVINQMAPDLGVKPKDALSVVTAAKAIHDIIPQIQAVPESLSKPRVDIGQLPQPADVLTPSIMQPSVVGQVSNYRPAMTPNQIRAQQAADQAAAIRQQRVSEVRKAGLPSYLEEASIGSIVGGINAVPVISSSINAQSRETIAANKANEFRGSRSLVVRNGMPLPIRGTGKDEFILDPQQGWIPYIPAEGDQVYEKPMPLGTVTGAKDVYSYDRKAGTVKPLNIGTPPARTAAPQSQLTTITTPEGPQLAEYIPGRGGKGTIKTVQQGAVKGTVPALSEGTQRELSGLGLGAKSLMNLQQLIPSISTGPLWGRLRNVKLRLLGGTGSTPDEVRVATQINMLMRSAFDTAGANFTEPEMNIFRRIYPQDTDTLETALTKIPESLKYIQDRMEIRKGLMTPMQRSQTQFPSVGAQSDTVKVRLPDGRTGIIPRANLEKAKSIGAIEVK